MVEQGESVIDWRQKSDEAFALVKLLRNASKIDKGKRRRPAVSAEVKSKGSPHERAISAAEIGARGPTRNGPALKGETMTLDG